MAEHRLDSVAQSKPLGASTMSLDEASARADALLKGMAAPKAEEKKPEEKKKVNNWGMSGQSQLDALEKENY